LTWKDFGGSKWCPGGTSCYGSCAAFLKEVKAGLVAAGSKARVTVDAACSSGAGVISDCETLAGGADLVMNMGTYNSDSYAHWLGQLAPAVCRHI
jgi:hypothetical protein